MFISIPGSRVQFPAADGRIAADFPGVSATDFVVDGSGQITNG